MLKSVTIKLVRRNNDNNINNNKNNNNKNSINKKNNNNSFKVVCPKNLVQNELTQSIF